MSKSFKLANDIFELCSDKLIARFNSFSQLKESSLNEIVHVDDRFDNVDCRSEVLLYGPDITIRIQFFYNGMFFGSNYLKNIYETVTQERVVDFFNEVGNLTGGKIKEILFEQGIVVALSLPMSINTTKNKIIQCQEVLANHKTYESNYKNQCIFLSKISFEIHNPEKFSKFNKNLSKLEIQDGEVDFF